MSYEEFQQLARLFIVGTLDDDEMDRFSAGRLLFGEQAEAFIGECRNLSAIFALSLQPKPPRPETKAKLLARIRASGQTARERSLERHSDDRKAPHLLCGKNVALDGRFLGHN